MYLTPSAISSPPLTSKSNCYCCRFADLNSHRGLTSTATSRTPERNGIPQRRRGTGHRRHVRANTGDDLVALMRRRRLSSALRHEEILIEISTADHGTLRPLPLATARIATSPPADARNLPDHPFSFTQVSGRTGRCSALRQHPHEDIVSRRLRAVCRPVSYCFREEWDIEAHDQELPPRCGCRRGKSLDRLVRIE